MEYIELCAGCGGFSKGLEMANLNGSMMIDNNKTCCETLKLNFKTTIICDDF